MASVGQLLRLSTILLALICRPAAGAVETASIRAMDLNPLSRMNPKIPKKQPRSGSTQVVPLVAARNSTRMTVRAIPKHSTLSRPSAENYFSDDKDSSPSSVTVRCRVKCIVSKLEDLPTVSFYFQIADETIMPLSSGIPGVDIFISATHSRRQRPYKDKDDSRAITTYRSDTHLALDSSAIPSLLRPGKNSFFCMASSPSTGSRKSDRFVVHIPPL